MLRARLEAASLELWGSACQQAYSLSTAAAHLVMIAGKFATQEEANRLKIVDLHVQLAGIQAESLAALAPVPPLNPDVRLPLSPLTNLSGEAFSQLITAGSSAAGAGFSTTATNNGAAADDGGSHAPRSGGGDTGYVGQPRRHRRPLGAAHGTRRRDHDDRRPVVRARR